MLKQHDNNPRERPTINHRRRRLGFVSMSSTSRIRIYEVTYKHKFDFVLEKWGLVQAYLQLESKFERRTDQHRTPNNSAACQLRLFPAGTTSKCEPAQVFETHSTLLLSRDWDRRQCRRGHRRKHLVDAFPELWFTRSAQPSPL